MSATSARCCYAGATASGWGRTAARREYLEPGMPVVVLTVETTLRRGDRDWKPSDFDAQ